MLLQSATLQKIITKNVVTLTIESSQLQNNFQLILTALKSHEELLNQFQNKFTTIDQQLGNLASGHNKNLENVNEIEKRCDLGIKDVHAGLSTLNDRLNQFEKFVAQSDGLKRQKVKEQEQNNQYAQLFQDLQQKYSIIEQNLDTKSIKLEQLEQALSQQEQKTKRLAQQLDKVKKISTEATRNSQEDNPEYDQFNKMKRDITYLREQTKTLQAQLRRLQMQVKVDLNEMITKPLNKLKQVQEELLKQNKKISSDIWKLNDQIYNLEANGKQKNAQNTQAIEDLQKQIEEIKASLAKMTAENRDRTISAKNHYSLKKTEYQWDTQTSPIKQKLQLQGNQKDGDQSDFKKQIIDKLKQQKGDFAKAIKKLDIVSTKKVEQQKQRLNRVEERIVKLQFVVESKVQEENLQKWMKYIENKISYLYRIVNFEGAEEDALIAKTNWICLSCDRKIEPYKGKVGKYLISAQAKGKTIETDIMGGGMLFKNKSKIELPQFKK